MKPHIPLPCSEDWNKMKVGLVSRHCDSCRKDVMDFTQMSRPEILTYLIENRNKEVCGHVNLSQLDFRHEEILVTIRDLEKKHRNTNLSYYLLTMATLTLMACETQPPKSGKPQTALTGEKQMPPKGTDSTGQKPVMGKAVCTPVSGEIEYPMVEGMMVLEAPEKPIPPSTIKEPEPITGDIIVYNSQEARITAEIMPEFYGGTDSLIAYVKANLVYPEWEKKRKIEGTVYASFVIDADGQVTHPQILRSVNGSKHLNDEVVKLLLRMPKWKPGMEKGEKIPVKFNMPFKFKL